MNKESRGHTKKIHYSEYKIDLLLGQPEFTCWVSFAPVFGFVCCWVLVFALSHFYVFAHLLSLCVLGGWCVDGFGSFIWTGHLCVLIRVWAGGEVAVSLGRFGPSSKRRLLNVRGRCFFCGSFVLFLISFVVLSCTSVCWCLVVACWRDGLLALVCGVWL